jgi:hypothetical protein
VVTVTVIASTGSAFTLITPLYNCATGAITFQTTGGNGNPVEYQVPILYKGWTRNPSHIVPAKHRTKSFKIQARQLKDSGKGYNVVEIIFNPAEYCASLSTSVKKSMAEETPELSVRVLGNPVLG